MAKPACSGPLAVRTTRVRALTPCYIRTAFFPLLIQKAEDWPCMKPCNHRRAEVSCNATHRTSDDRAKSSPPYGGEDEP